MECLARCLPALQPPLSVASLQPQPNTHRDQGSTAHKLRAAPHPNTNIHIAARMASCRQRPVLGWGTGQKVVQVAGQGRHQQAWQQRFNDAWQGGSTRGGMSWKSLGTRLELPTTGAAKAQVCVHWRGHCRLPPRRGPCASSASAHMQCSQLPPKLEGPGARAAHQLSLELAGIRVGRRRCGGDHLLPQLLVLLLQLLHLLGGKSGYCVRAVGVQCSAVPWRRLGGSAASIAAPGPAQAWLMPLETSPKSGKLTYDKTHLLLQGGGVLLALGARAGRALPVLDLRHQGPGHKYVALIICSLGGGGPWSARPHVRPPACLPAWPMQTNSPSAWPPPP